MIFSTMTSLGKFARLHVEGAAISQNSLKLVHASPDVLSKKVLPPMCILEDSRGRDLARIFVTGCRNWDFKN